MQIEEDHQNIKESTKDNNNKIISLDQAIQESRASNTQNIRGCSHSNPWPVLGFSFLQRSVISTQLWLHKIQFYTIFETIEIIHNFESTENNNRINEQLFFVYDFETNLKVIFNSEITWNNIHPFIIKSVRIINYIDYLLPLTSITGRSIITTLIARATSDTQHILDSELVSIGEFRPFYWDHPHCWRYYKETRELYRNNNFKSIHNYNLFKSVNYKVQQRVVLSLNQFVYLEIILVKKRYFQDIVQYYSDHNQYLIHTSTFQHFNIPQPHQFDTIDTIDKIITEYHPQH